MRNGRSNGSITVQMAGTSQTDGKTYYQAFVRILDSRAEDAQGTLLYTSSDGPDCVQDTSVTPIPPNYATGVDQDATASILARHGDRITIDVEGAGTVSVEVDGEGPDISGITPEDLSYVRFQPPRFLVRRCATTMQACVTTASSW